jgi:CRP/FNR family transcriptional regulator, nitrogen fixation regulation protein
MLAQGVAGRPYVPPQSMARHRPDAEPIAAGAGPLDLSGTTLTVAPNAEIYGEEEPARFLYKVVSGAVRTSKLLSDGRRQICSFYLPGDMFGLDAGELHRFSAEAITASVVRVLDRRRVTAAAEREGGLRSQLLSLTAHELCHAHDHMLPHRRDGVADPLGAGELRCNQAHHFAPHRAP